MFYLLENNRIIETNSAEWYCGRLKVVLNENERYKYSNHIFWNAKDGYYKYFTVKKQSENVVDLIEKGDLVKLDKTLNQVIAILKENKRTSFEIGYNKWFSFKELNNYLNNNRFTIYKPDEKGNYIKVWERKEEDDKHRK